MSSLRIVSLLSSATEMLYALGLGEQVVAVSHECDWPPEVAGKPRATASRIDSTQASGAIDDQVRSRLAAGESLYEVDGELIASLRPDLIVTQAQCDVCAVRLEDVRTLIQSRPELKSSRLVSLQPNRLDDVFADILQLGEATQRQAEARELVAALEDRVERVKQWTAIEVERLGRPHRVAIIEWTEPLMLAGNWTPELVALAGGDCPLTIAGEHSRYHTWSEIAAFEPEVIVVAPCGFDLPRSLAESRHLDKLPGWHDTSAARADRVFAMDGNAYLNRSGPRLVDTLEILAELFWNDRTPCGTARLAVGRVS